VTPTKVSLGEKLALFDEHWSPRIVARYNDNEVRLAKASGDFTWHRHEDSDELFLVLGGELEILFRDGSVTLGPGELVVVPRGVEHCPRALGGEVQMLIIDPAGSPNTGDPQTAARLSEI
jgi:mannose-6-phosphate isomerase-like protein (cupin superfamily)